LQRTAASVDRRGGDRQSVRAAEELVEVLERAIMLVVVLEILCERVHGFLDRDIGDVR
jgi:hypothetical protein